jgi:hypothetical protein
MPPLALLALPLLLALAGPAWLPQGPLVRPAAGTHSLEILSPNVVELSLFDQVARQGRPPRWDLQRGAGLPKLPPETAFRATVDGRPARVSVLGFRRRALHVPRQGEAFLVGSHLVLALEPPIPEGGVVRVVRVAAQGPAAAGRDLQFEGRADPARTSSAIHVSQGGYDLALPKQARVGRYLGDAGELAVTADGFALVDDATGQVVLRGPLVLQRDRGYDYQAYQRVYLADFTALDAPGRYRVQVPGLGASLPFQVGHGAAAVARTLASGLYNQRCGAAVSLPWSRFTHPACHLAPAQPITARPGGLLHRLKGLMQDEATPLYPPVEPGPLDLHGGHHDAGDYGKYTATSAELVHVLTFAVDALPGVAGLDDLGLPESGDGEPDLLQEAAWEAAFLARMQDRDGGFFTLLQPRDRAYEDDVLPEAGDPQAAFPKGTVATAAGSAALAQLASSPRFRQRHPAEAERYLKAALDGWAFLERAWRSHGRPGAFQALHHYGAEFNDADEIAWAATELYLATGEARFLEEVRAALKAEDVSTRRWTWWRLYEGWGAAFRDCAFARASGRPHAFDEALTAACRAEVLAAARDVAARVAANAYGAPLPLEDKRFRNVAWFSSSNAGFDLVPGLALAPEPGWREAYTACLAFETGANPADLSFLTGLGDRRPVEVVHQYAWNDRRALPPDGLALGNLVATVSGRTPLGRAAAALTWPPDDDPRAPYAPYDRFTDIEDTTAEPVSARLARSLAGAAWLMASVPRPAPPTPTPALSITRTAPHAWHLEWPRDLDPVRILWEGDRVPPRFGGAELEAASATRWLEVEVTWPDGRRSFAAWGAGTPGQEGAP